MERTVSGYPVVMRVVEFRGQPSSDVPCDFPAVLVAQSGDPATSKVLCRKQGCFPRLGVCSHSSLYHIPALYQNRTTPDAPSIFIDSELDARIFWLSEYEAMEISGHKTRAVFDRYHIVSDRKMKQNAANLEGHLKAMEASVGEDSGGRQKLPC